MTKVYIILACYVLVPLLIIEGFKRWKWVQTLGTVVLAYAVALLLRSVVYSIFKILK